MLTKEQIEELEEQGYEIINDYSNEDFDDGSQPEFLNDCYFEDNY